MHYSNILLPIAEISGVLIGFANLASVFEKSNEDEVLRQTNKIRLLMITEGGIIGIFACLLPFLLLTFNYNEIITFRIASLILLPAIILNIVFNFKRGKRLTGIPILAQLSGLPSQTKIGSIVILFCMLTVTPVALVCVGYFDDGTIAGMYCLSVFSSFMTLCIFLIRFIRQIIS